MTVDHRHMVPNKKKKKKTVHYRVDRVLGFLCSRPSWDSPTPSPADECVPPFFGWGGGVSQFRREEQTLWSSIDIYLLGQNIHSIMRGNLVSKKDRWQNSYLSITGPKTSLSLGGGGGGKKRL
jgi:hypothetical protein